MVNSGFAAAVTRQRKSPELVPVDESSEPAKGEHYIRLNPDGGIPDVLKIITPEHSQDTSMKLPVINREELNSRRSQPGIESLIDAELNTLAGLEENWGKPESENRPLPWGWFALIAIFLAGGALWSLKNVFVADEHIAVIRIEAESILQDEETSVETARELIGRIQSTIAAFCMAPDIETMTHFIRHLERVRPLMDDHYSRNPFETLGPATVETLRPLTLGTHGDFWVATLKLRDGGSKNLIVQAREKGPALVDWETAVNYQPMVWDDFARQRPVESPMDFRVYLQPDSLHTHEFQDASKWDSYMLTALNSEEMLFGYVRTDSPTAQLLRAWFARNRSQRAAMIMRLSIPEGLASPRGVVIDHALSVRWIYISKPNSGGS